MEELVYNVLLAVITALIGVVTTQLIPYLKAKQTETTAKLRQTKWSWTADIIGRGYVTKDEYENLYKYLYKPYKALGGNGTAEKMIHEVNNLPMKTRRIEDEQN